MKTKILLIAIAYYVLVAISACCKCEPNRNFIYSGFKVDINSCSFPVDSSSQFEKITSDSLSKNMMGIELNFEGTIVFNEAEYESFPSFINTANACKCDLDYYTTDPISAVKIVTLNDFDSSHPATSDVTEYFKVLENAYSSGKAAISQKPISDYFQYSTSNYAPGFYLNIYMAQFPEHEGYAQFQIKATLKNGKEFEATTAKIYLY